VASFASLTSLTALALDNVSCGLADGLAGLSALTGLQQLLLGRLHLAKPPHQQLQNAAQIQQHLMQRALDYQQPWRGALNSLHHLSQLTQLELRARLELGQAPGLFQHMQQLQELKLLQATVVCPDALQDLPASITMLELSWDASSQLSSSTVPSLARLTAMQHLTVDAADSGGLHPGFISSMKQLRILNLAGPMDGGAQQQQQQLGNAGAAAAAAVAPLRALLDALPGFTQLEDLAISNTSEADMEPLPASDVGRYAALLPASTRLEFLQLTWQQGCLLPSDCWQHVFAAGWQLPQLKDLRIGLAERVWDFHSDADVVALVAEQDPCLGHDELTRLVQRCPALELLRIPGLVQPDVDWSPLTALTALTGMCIGGDAVDDNAASMALAQLTGLQSLQIHHAPHMTDQGLLEMSALRRLTRLGAWDCGFSAGVADAFTDMTELEVQTKVIRWKCLTVISHNLCCRCLNS
jgi:hypothetical protein